MRHRPASGFARLAGVLILSACADPQAPLPDTVGVPDQAELQAECPPDQEETCEPRLEGPAAGVATASALVGVAVDGLVDARAASNGETARTRLRDIVEAQEAYHGLHERYGSLAELYEAQLVEDDVAGGSKQGYLITVDADTGSFHAAAIAVELGVTGDGHYHAGFDQEDEEGAYDFCISVEHVDRKSTCLGSPEAWMIERWREVQRVRWERDLGLVIDLAALAGDPVEVIRDVGEHLNTREGAAPGLLARFDGDGDGARSFTEILDAEVVDDEGEDGEARQLVTEWRAAFADWLRLGVANEDVATLPVVALSFLAVEPVPLFTYDGICVYADLFLEDSGLSRPLCALLENAREALASGNREARNGMLTAFRNQVLAHSGKALSSR
jgi:hypothetical protein